MNVRRAVAMVSITIGVIGAIVTASPGDAHAQPMAGGMPDPRAISGHPLPDRGMAPGTVSVRVGRKSPANPVTNVEVVGLLVAPGGDSRKRTAKTDGEGRALFEGIPAGSQFHAEVTVDGETLASDSFAIPESGGVRMMLIAGLGPPPGDEAAGDESNDTQAPPAGDERKRPFTMGIISGVARMDSSLPAGTVEVLALDEARRPIANQEIELAHVEAGGQVQVTRQITGADGVARFSGLAAARAPATAGETAASVGAAVVMRHGSLRLGTEGFAIPATGGIKAELDVPQRTSDPSVITIGSGGRLILQMRDDAPGFIETWPLENHSDKVFDPGPGGVEIPLPAEFINAEGAEGEHKIEIRKGVGVAVHGIIPPRRPQPADPNRKDPDEVTLGFLLPATGSSRSFEQRFPNGVGEFTFVTEQIPGLTIDSSQITGRQDRDLGTKKYWLMRGESIPPGGTLRLTIRGLPSTDATGRIIALMLALALIAATIVFARTGGSKRGQGAPDDRDQLVQRRERLFGELVTIEARGSTEHNGTARRELVQKLEIVYRELATLDEQRAV